MPRRLFSKGTLAFICFCCLFFAASARAQVFHDEFDGVLLDTSKWQPLGGGDLVVGEGFATSRQNGSGFPYVLSQTNPFPSTGDFIVQVGFRYPDVSGAGHGFGNPAFRLGNSGTSVWVWQDGGGLRAACGEQVVPISPVGDTAYHVYEWQYLDGVYYLSVDGVERASSASSARPSGFFFGHPASAAPASALAGDRIQQIDFVRVWTPFPVNTTVVGRGTVSRSRVGGASPPGGLLTLVAAALPGDRFVGWSGDTTSTSDTLVVTPNRALSFTATFERDPAAAAKLVMADDVPADQGGFVRVTWNRSSLDDTAYSGLLCCYRIERRPESATASHWTSLSVVPAAAIPTYELVTATPTDSTQADPAVFRYRVVTEAAGDTVQWASSEALGYSVDNVPPPAPSSVSGVVSSGVATLFWPAASAPDFSHYAIYRGLQPVPPTDAAHRVGTTTALSFSDSPGYFAYYRVTSVDIHGNDSQGTQLVPLNPADVGSRPAPQVLSVGNPSPSPMGRRMSLSLGLPRAMTASVEVLDAQGRFVRRLCEGEQSAGWLTVTWDARTNDGHLSDAGMYFVRVRTPAGEIIKRLVLLP